MVLDSLGPLFSTLGSAASTAQAFKHLIQSNKGEARLLMEELKKNATLCWLAAEREVQPPAIIGQLTTVAYDRLLAKGFDFKKLSPKRKKIPRLAGLESSDLSSFIGKDVGALLESIYDRIKEMQLIQQVDPANKRINFNRRILNLHKRILLLMSHLRGWTA